MLDQSVEWSQTENLEEPLWKNLFMIGFRIQIKYFYFEDTIDNDYTDEIIVLLENDGNTMFMINKKYRIAQIIIVRIHQRNWMRIVQHGEFPQTKRGSGGFGSTGR